MTGILGCLCILSVKHIFKFVLALQGPPYYSTNMIRKSHSWSLTWTRDKSADQSGPSIGSLPSGQSESRQRQAHYAGAGYTSHFEPRISYFSQGVRIPFAIIRVCSQTVRAFPPSSTLFHDIFRRPLPPRSPNPHSRPLRRVVPIPQSRKMPPPPRSLLLILLLLLYWVGRIAASSAASAVPASHFAFVPATDGEGAAYSPNLSTSPRRYVASHPFPTSPRRLLIGVHSCPFVVSLVSP